MKRTLLTSLGLLAAVATSPALTILVDYDDGLANGIHDTSVLDGDFGSLDNTNFSTLAWEVISGGSQVNNGIATPVGTDVNSVQVAGRVNGLNTGHVLSLGNRFFLEYLWRDASNWDNGDHVQAVLFYTDSNTLLGTATDIFTLNSGNRDARATWEIESAVTSPFADAGGVGKTLFLRLETEGSNGPPNAEFARIDNVYLAVPASGHTLPLFGLAVGGMAWARRRKLR